MCSGGRREDILSLCDLTGVWSQPYRDAGYYVEQVDLQRDGRDVLLRQPRAVAEPARQPALFDATGTGE